MKKKIISVFLLLVFSTQVLPVAQIGRMLYQNQLTEELPHSTTSAPAPNSFIEELHKAYWQDVQGENVRLYTLIITHHLHESEKFFTQFIAEVQTPPPNC
ncbi:MAG: hypothetical protein HYR66_07060 [Sphingobacteriales bacterium]|nr:hypothetical protein [Sphingobacteriales bacterium]MBI3718135.1 hypothetical protein [Sphingobacteriales bacterium]